MLFAVCNILYAKYCIVHTLALVLVSLTMCLAYSRPLWQFSRTTSFKYFACICVIYKTWSLEGGRVWCRASESGFLNRAHPRGTDFRPTSDGQLKSRNPKRQTCHFCSHEAIYHEEPFREGECKTFTES